MNRYLALALAAALALPALLPAAGRATNGGPERVAIRPAIVEAAPPTTLPQALDHIALVESRALDQEARCLAQAVYFEARSEPVEGQFAVAQVVLNRVKSRHWPDSVCAVVFQNEHRRHRCQFSFACDGVSDTPRNPVAWKKAQRVALLALENLWRDITDESTHYHADYVAPDWRERLQPTTSFGRHQFYRETPQTRMSAAEQQTG